MIVNNGKINRSIDIKIGELMIPEIGSNMIDYQTTQVIQLETKKNVLANEIIEYIVVFRDSNQQIVQSRDIKIHHRDEFDLEKSSLYQHQINDGVVLLQYRLKASAQKISELDFMVGSIYIAKLKVKVYPNKPTKFIQCDKNKVDLVSKLSGCDVLTDDCSTYFKMRDAYGNEMYNLNYHYLNVKLINSK